MERMGDRTEGITSMKDMSSGQAAPLPDVEAAHRRLMEDEAALEYLVGERGFTMDVIRRQKLGVESFDGKKWIVYPYIYHGRVVFSKSRSLPPAEKAFRGTSGREQPLYNEEALVNGLEDITLCEGESDLCSCLSAGIERVVGVPGCSQHKAVWIAKLDSTALKKIYLLYDNDKPGQKSARDMAVRIGIEKVFNILLPPFERVDGKPGKDINEWFRAGHTLEEFEALKQQARPFDVEGVTSTVGAIDELEDELLGKGSLKPTYDSPWPSLNERLGGMEIGDVVSIIACGKTGKSTLALNWLDYLVDKYKEPGLFYCLEMTPRRLVRKWVSYITRTDDSPGASQLTIEKIREAKHIALNRQADMLFGYTRGGSADDALNTIRQAVRRYGVKFVVFDNLQYLIRSLEHSAQETSIVSKKFKNLAMELGIVIILIVQPNRVREGEIVSASNARGSSAIETDVDAMIALHRNRVAKLKQSDLETIGFLETEANFEPRMYARVDLSRYAPGGQAMLCMEGAMSLVREYTEEERKSGPHITLGAEIPQESPVVEA
jgi:twinkle protein